MLPQTARRVSYSFSNIAQYIGVAAIAALAAWWWLSPRGDTPYIAACRPLYASARTHEDTLRIDGLIPLQQDEPRVDQPTCGTIRATHPDRFRPERNR